MSELSYAPLVPENAEGVVVTLTAVSPTANGRLTASRYGATSVSTLNFKQGVNTSNSASVRLQPDGDLVVYNSHGYTDVVIDVVGYFYKG